MTTDVALYSAPLPQKLQYAQELANSGLLPAQYRGRPANLLYAIEYGQMVGIAPMAAITGVHVIEGKPSASAALISALVRRAGHKLRVRGDAQSATAQIIRSDDPDYTFEVTYTMTDARQAGLTTKDVWKKYPASMLKSRAITQCARDACEEALFGLHYTPEELGAQVDEEGLPVAAPAVRSRPAGPVADEWSTPAASGPRAATAEQRAGIVRLLGERRGLTDPAACLAVISELAGREVAGTAELTWDEAEAVGHALAAEAEAPIGNNVPDCPAEVVDAEVVDEAETVEEPAAAEPEPPAEPEQPAKGDVSDAQMRMLHALMKGWTREEKLLVVSQIVGRDVESSADLTKREASALIDELQRSAERIRDRVRQGAQLPAEEPAPQDEGVSSPEAAEQLLFDLLAGLDSAATGQQLADVYARASKAVNKHRITSEQFGTVHQAYMGVQGRLADEALAAKASPVSSEGWSHRRLAVVAGVGR